MAADGPTSDDAPPVELEPASTPGMPRWVKVSLLIVLALVAVVVILNLLGIAPGGHGPMRHVPGGGAPASTTVPSHGPGMHNR